MLKYLKNMKTPKTFWGIWVFFWVWVWLFLGIWVWVWVWVYTKNQTQNQMNTQLNWLVNTDIFLSEKYKFQNLKFIFLKLKKKRKKHLPVRLISNVTHAPEFLITWMASACVIWYASHPLISRIWSPTCSRPSSCAGPISANLSTNSGILNSLPPRILNPKPPCTCLRNSITWYSFWLMTALV